MTQRYLGGIITANPVEPSSNLSNASASGMWTLQEALSFYRAGDWPDPNIAPNFVFTVAGINTSSASTNIIDRVSVNSAGNASDFGDLTNTTYYTTAFGNNTRGIHAGGYSDTGSARVDVIDYFSLASAGNATDFGNLSAAKDNVSGFSNNVRGIVNGGRISDGSRIDVLEYLTIQTTGNVTDFGDFAVGDRSSTGATSSSTRGLMLGGHNGSAVIDIIEYLTIANTGNTVDFGNLSAARVEVGAVASSTRAVVAGGNTGSGAVDIIEYVTIANTGNATDFGNLTASTRGPAGGGNATTGLFAGGYISNAVNTIENITIATTGNASDWGDLSVARGFSGAHGNGEPAVQNETGFAPAAMGLIAGGNEPNNTTIAYINIASTSNEIQFGDLTSIRYRLSGVASATRCVWWGGYIGSNTAAMEFSTFSTKGIAQNFGNLTSLNNSSLGSVSNGTRGVLA